MPAPEGNTYAAGNEGGRPSNYVETYAQQAYKLCLLGATDADLADFFEVTETTINNWKNAHQEFFESIKKGKTLADAEVADSLYNRAIGYSHPDTHFTSFEGNVIQTPTTKYYPPDPTSAIFWLKNRQRKHWRDKVDVEQTTEVTVTVKRQKKEQPKND
ncbi:hypothetical protein GCM10028808_72960 [Spirosoma migulaei]